MPDVEQGLISISFWAQTMTINATCRSTNIAVFALLIVDLNSENRCIELHDFLHPAMSKVAPAPAVPPQGDAGLLQSALPVPALQ